MWITDKEIKFAMSGTKGGNGCYLLTLASSKRSSELGLKSTRWLVRTRAQGGMCFTCLSPSLTRSVEVFT